MSYFFLSIRIKAFANSENSSALNPSGTPAIFAVQVAKLGFHSTLFGCVGNDDFGRLNVARLKREGVNTAGICMIDNVPTGTAFVSYRNHNERDFIFNIPNSACGHFTTRHIEEGLLKSCQHLHIMGSSLFSFRIIHAVHNAIKIIKDNNGTVSFDPNIRKEMVAIPEMEQAFDYILEYTDIFLPSEGEVSYLARTPQQTEFDVVRELLESGISHVVIKRGASGASHCQYTNRVEERHVVGLSNTLLDPTGAGDCFGATFVRLYLAGFTPEKALAYANASGALAVSHRGTMEDLSTREDIEATLRASSVVQPA